MSISIYIVKKPGQENLVDRTFHYFPELKSCYIALIFKVKYNVESWYLKYNEKICKTL